MTTTTEADTTQAMRGGSSLEVLRVFFRLGISSFGGPIAHIGYFREEFVVRRKWIDEHAFADLVGLCQFLPGPASSQVGFSIGLMRAGYRGALRCMGRLHLALRHRACAGRLRCGRAGKPGRIGIAARPQASRRGHCGASGVGHGALLVPRPGARVDRPGGSADHPVQQRIGGAGRRDPCSEVLPAYGSAVRRRRPTSGAHRHAGVARASALRRSPCFVSLLAGLPIRAKPSTGASAIALFDAFYRSGALVFGGGHVVLPLLRDAFVDPGWVSDDAFLAGYGAAQAVPGPLFTFAAYLGARPSARRRTALGRRRARPDRHLSSRRPDPAWGACRSGDSFRKRAHAQAICAASTPPLSGCWVLRSTIPSGPVR